MSHHFSFFWQIPKQLWDKLPAEMWGMIFNEIGKAKLKKSQIPGWQLLRQELHETVSYFSNLTMGSWATANPDIPPKLTADEWTAAFFKSSMLMRCDASHVFRDA